MAITSHKPQATSHKPQATSKFRVIEDGFGLWLLACGLWLLAGGLYGVLFSVFVRYTLRNAPFSQGSFVLYSSSSIASRAKISRCNAGYASDCGACRDRDSGTRCHFAGRRIAPRKALRVDATGRCNGNSSRLVSFGCTERGARGMDRRAWHHYRAVLGRGSDSRSSGQSPEFTPRSRRAASMWRIRDHRPHRVGAGGDGDGETLQSSTRRGNRIRRAHNAHIDGECETRLAHPARQLPLEANTIWRSGRGGVSAHSRQRTIAWMESAHRDIAAGDSI
jgi:hypothetical protein